MILEMSLELCGSKGDISLLMVDLEEAQVEPGDRGSANLNGSFNIAPRFSKAVRGSWSSSYFSKVLEHLEESLMLNRAVS